MKKLVLIPTYNERDNIKKVLSLLPLGRGIIDVLVIDDNSPDGTADIVRNFQRDMSGVMLYVRPQKEGLGKAYVDAFRKVLRDYPEYTHVITMDADLSHDPTLIPHMCALAQNSDLVIGSRYTKGGGTQGWSTWRKFISRYGNLYTRLVTGMPITDITGGFNCISMGYLKKLPLDKLESFTGYTFLMALKDFLLKRGASYTEFPIIFKDRQRGHSKIPRNIIVEGLVTPWRIRSGG